MDDERDKILESYERLRAGLKEMAALRGHEWSDQESREATDNFIGFMKAAIKIRIRQQNQKDENAQSKYSQK